jgi:methylase of polypeptide subunit release factors
MACLVLRRLLQIAPEWLAPGGMILLEIEASQGMSAVSLAYDAFDKRRNPPAPRPGRARPAGRNQA